MSFLFLARLFAVLAIFSLGMIGGTFSHAAETHEHEPGISKSVDSHTHAKTDRDLVEKNGALHCGSNILSTLNTSTFCFPKKRGLAPVGSLNINAENIAGYEPPPPRAVS